MARDRHAPGGPFSRSRPPSPCPRSCDELDTAAAALAPRPARPARALSDAHERAFVAGAHGIRDHTLSACSVPTGPHGTSAGIPYNVAGSPSEPPCFWARGNSSGLAPDPSTQSPRRRAPSPRRPRLPFTVARSGAQGREGPRAQPHAGVVGVGAHGEGPALCTASTAVRSWRTTGRRTSLSARRWVTKLPVVGREVALHQRQRWISILPAGGSVLGCR